MDTTVLIVIANLLVLAIIIVTLALHRVLNPELYRHPRPPSRPPRARFEIDRWGEVYFASLYDARGAFLTMSTPGSRDDALNWIAAIVQASARHDIIDLTMEGEP